ncbi:glycine cleavage system protein GcvH [Chamaesiphon minutus]|uniref:Glycine cleavage system H protein n=1 Tax=Chamaesiphon minutus (strain ATCC 27169 / PCC 6605) TaxID=1173020 RepID=K9UII4_CHAP6|nr:glycine cleavage system protein GcvH [Chamaesiphon minutus]AFY94463.1 glycine cleavage system H protein [Chamaesiphon minutus PCC 6605]
MSLEYPDNLRYTDSHEYVELTADTATVGVSAFAVDQLGDIVFVDLPEVGDTIVKGSAFGTIESVKAVEDLKAPISGTVTKRNDAAIDAPEIISTDPYTTGWLLEVQVADPNQLDGTFSAAEYRAKVEGA